jgi:hypothetical protein
VARVPAQVLAHEPGNSSVQDSEKYADGSRGAPNRVGPASVEQHDLVAGQGKRQHTSKSEATRVVAARNADSNLHYIVRMGWTPLCAVARGDDATGVLWGGHEGDVYVRATSGACRSLPSVDIRYGRSLMGCSYFEKIAGREPCKKWKESIFWVGDRGTPGAVRRSGRNALVRWLKE